MSYLSIDCANKSLAIGFYTLNLNNWKQNLLSILQNKTLNYEDKLILSNNLLDNVVNINFLQVIDLIPNQKVKETSLIDRSIQLKFYITKIKNDIENKSDDIINIFIEYQMNANDKSRCIFNQLIYAFSDTNLYKISVVIPTLKNKIYFSEELKHCKILQRYNRVYTANKIHCKENFLLFINLFNKKKYIKDIKKKNIDDIADTFMQMLGYLYN